ncbi:MULTISPECIES: hypothetical protein [unclassified Gilliamella]|uniref:hypothetical protein n=1 Tax=unclassified Gilliamella TaxID=2685620 RepID=UPI00132BD111|nr:MULTISPECIES: hypothetical protein [unclassified Gilliamella]MWN32469.1 hypothetical protein [Gilliamella sp. Pra-s60]MWP29856.1 hypothetical protein [Gilliamella sp. Pra-s54]
MRYHNLHLACQPYALNSIHFHRSRKQNQFLLLSPKPLNSVLFPRLSTELSSRLKFLSFLSKSPLFFAPLLSLTYSHTSQALSAHTSSVIEGSAPYLTLDGGRTKVTNTDALLVITLPDGTKITPSTNTSSATNPIILSAEHSFGDIGMLVPLSSYSVSLNDLITQGYWGDDDGDSDATATGSLSVAITDKNGRSVNRSDTLNICTAPYKITLSCTNGSVTTRYGVPNSHTFNGSSVAYYITPPSSPTICSVKPNLYNGTGIFAGPPNIWEYGRGFLTQSTNPSSYGLNFPTTGADGLYFDLEIGGVDESQLTWSPVTHGGITATVTRIIPNDNWISIVDRKKTVTRVTLNGPRASSDQINAENPSPLNTPSLPQVFELKGKNSKGDAVVKYGFKLGLWFVHRGEKNDTSLNQITWCSDLGYRMPQVRELTNAVCSGWNSGSWCQDAVGATPPSTGNYYLRHIGAGFFTEWGNMQNYIDSGFIYNRYWMSGRTGNFQFVVDSSGGYVYSYNDTVRLYGLCTAP